MPPTIQNSPASKRKNREKGKEGFVCNVKYTNTLPDIPFDAKFITYPFEANRFIQYKPTSLERNYKHELLTEPDLGVTIDLINPETYDIDVNAELDPSDERLLEEELAPQADQKRHRQHTKTVSWLRKTEYISTEYNRFQTSNEMAEKQIAFGQKKKSKGAIDLYKDRDSQIEAIEASFEAAKKPITQHFSNPRLKPVEILPFFPDFQFWHMPCAHVIFDTEPTPRGKTSPATLQQMSLGMIRGMEDESGDQFVAYFLPTDKTLSKRKAESHGDAAPTDDEEYDYKLAREYNWNVKNKAIKGFEENYFFVFREGEGVFYNELQTRVRLNKRRGRGGAGGVSSAVSKLVVKNREPTENEIRLQNARLVQLENVAQEEDDDEADDSDADEQQSAKNADQTENTDQGEKTNEEDKESDSADDLFGSSSGEDDE
ncbi:RNA polymerase II-associated factor 1 homolog isoform X1 [Hydractinia symbiolongicarpus]|uniref:RNA polymerase II-associated factor 1 homolog isoform X1 n=1 Tax=Hydractinia symbiolongicarpus TaxID=13093 RepID=UPI00255198EB|nr:RNA polymerase II-associated factor 1 homolog isoform X1 [Hydractinia symbiolongicarpus]